jgi:hypothetical protein
MTIPNQLPELALPGLDQPRRHPLDGHHSKGVHLHDDVIGRLVDNRRAVDEVGILVSRLADRVALDLSLIDFSLQDPGRE